MPARRRSRLDFYQNGPHRLTRPLAPARRRDVRGDRLGHRHPRGRRALRGGARAHGGESIFYYGGGGQGNHLPGAYARATRAVLGSRYLSSALAQEKTGEFWVAGGCSAATRAAISSIARSALFLGKNPWHSHGIPRARVTLREIARDPGAA